MCATKWFFFTYLAIQVEALTDPFMDFLVDEALKNLRQVVDDPTVLPSVDGTEMSMDFGDGSVKLENGKLVGLKTMARTHHDVISSILIDEDKPKLQFTAQIEVGEASAHYDAIISLFGFEASNGISVSITNLQGLFIAEMNLQDAGWKVGWLQFIHGWPSTEISVEGAAGMGADFVEIGLKDQLDKSVAPTLMGQFEDSLNLPSLNLPILLDQFLLDPNSSGISDELLDFIESLDFIVEEVPY